MKRVILGISLLASLSAIAQQTQPGTPAQLEVSNGKSANVFLQRIEGNTLMFQSVGSARNMPAPVGQIASLTFFPKYDAIGLERSFADADYEEVVLQYGRALAPYWAYMSISNNVQMDLLRLTRSYLKTGELEKVIEAANTLQASRHEPIRLQGQSFALQVALATNDVAAAEAVYASVESEPAKLFLGACIERAKQQPREAIKLLTQLIAEHGNELDWMPAAELLCAELYLDMEYTNSAVATARQVSRIYRGDAVAGEALLLKESLPEPPAEPPAE